MHRISPRLRAPALRPSFDATAERWIVPPSKTSSTLKAEIIDGLTTIAGLLVFAAVALFFLVLA